MILFFDTEFTGLHQNTTLISLAVIDEDGRAFYAEFSDYNQMQISPWQEENVLKNLKYGSESQRNKIDNEGNYFGDSTFIKGKLVKWLNYYGHQKLTFVYDVGMYDWVLFCELFGGALNLPENINYCPIEFSTIMYLKGLDTATKRVELLDEEGRKELHRFGKQHNALYDTALLKLCFEKLLNS